MCYILVSFIPWIVYWIFATPQSVISAHAMAMVILIPQISKREFNIMDVVTFFYFTAAFVATIIYDATVFLEHGRVLGYGVLFLMALGSILAGKPYTLQVSKRDYPESMWKDKTFLAINNSITLAWAGVFLLSALVYQFLELPWTVLISNLLIAGGIVFSVVFPAKAPARILAARYKQYDWKPGADPAAPKGEDEYDVIIVGSGIGGLTCGAILSRRGYKVLVLEQHYLAGGFCSAFKRKGFTFNTGVENVSGLWSGGPVHLLLEELGLDREELFVKNRMRYVFKGEEIDAGDLPEFKAELARLFPAEEEGIAAFFDEAAKAYEECYSETKDFGTPLPAELIVKAYGEKALSDYPKTHPHFFAWMNTSYKAKLDQFFQDEDLKMLLCALVGYLGTEPDKTPAAGALTACVAYYLHGGYFTRGSAQKFADSLKEVIENNGGRVLLRHRADRILVAGGAVKGVESKGRLYGSDVVVSNANAKTTFLELIEEGHLEEKFLQHIRELKMSPSCVMVSLGVDMDLSGYPTIIHNLDEEYNLVFNSNADPSLAPAGKASLSILAGASYHDFPERGREEYLEMKEQVGDRMLEKVEKVLPGLRDRVIVKDVATPRTFERYTSVPEGAIYVFDQSIGAERPYFKTPVRGLYLAGASTFPGGGIEAVVISGMIAARDICGWTRR
jgi:all-trans-retinol 13,14-reductase